MTTAARCGRCSRVGLACAALAAGLLVSACSAGVGYEPEGTPLEFSATFTVSPDGTVSVEGSAGIITEAGIFSVHAGIQIPVHPEPEQTILIVIHWQGTRHVESVYRIGTGEQVVVTLNGHTVVQVRNQKILINVAAGTAMSIRVDSAPVSLTESQLRAGYCLRGADLRLNTTIAWPYQVTGVPCDEEHTAEVYYLAGWNTTAEFPGQKVINSRSYAACHKAFQRYVGIPDSASKLNWIYIDPDSSNWSSGNRELVCVAFRPTSGVPSGAPLYASVKNSRQ